MPDDRIRQAQQALNAAGYLVGDPDGRAGSQTLVALKRFQTDHHLVLSGKFDDITLAALGVGNTENGANGGLILADAVNALVQIMDGETNKPVFYAATNAGLYRSLEPTKGWTRLPYHARLDPRTSCVSISPLEPQTIWVGTAGSGVLFHVTEERLGGKIQGYLQIFQSTPSRRIVRGQTIFTWGQNKPSTRHTTVGETGVVEVVYCRSVTSQVS